MRDAKQHYHQTPIKKDFVGTVKMQVKTPFTQEIHFVDGSRQTIYNIVHIEQGNWYHIFTEKGEYYITNPDKILFIKVFGDLSDNMKGLIADSKKRFD